MSPPAPLSPIRNAWYIWKSLKLPWRKRFLIGLDLQGNTFWEFRDTLSSHKYRMRRIVEYPPSVHYSDINISPQWHQWLRHTRKDPPSLTEQSQDLVRQRNLKILAAEVDRRWAEKPSFLDTPGQQRRQLLPGLEVKDPGGYVKSMRGVRSKVGGELGGKVQGTDMTVAAVAAAVEGQSGEGKITMQVPDHRGHHFNEGANGEKVKEKVEDPWKKARGGPSEEWQPTAWDPSNASVR